MVHKYFLSENADVFLGINARSRAVHEYDKFIHTTCYPFMIHPHSTFRVYWEISLIVFFVCQYIFFVIWGFVRHDSLFYQSFVAFMFLVHLVDTVLKFFTGYMEKGSGIVVLDPKRIAWRYMRKYFIFDALACLPVEFVMYFYEPECVAGTPVFLEHSCQIIMYLTIFAIYCRIITSVRYLANVYQVMFWNPFHLNLATVIIYFLFILSLNMILTFLMNYTLNIRPLNLDNYWRILETVANFLVEMTFMFVYRGGCSGLLYGVRVPATIATSFFSMYLMAYFIKYTRFTMRTKGRFYILETKVRIFARKRRLPLSLKKKTFLYFKVLLQSRVYKQDEMFNYFPEAFRSDILTHFCLPIIRGFYYFEDFPIHVMRRLTESLRYLLYLPNEIVMMKDETDLSLYFVLNGTVALYGEDNTELYHFEDGSIFNTVNFFEGKFPQGQYAISVEVTELYRLDHDDFTQIMSAYPTLMQRIQEKISKNLN